VPPSRRFSFPLCQPRPRSTKRNATFLPARAPRPRLESSCTRRSTTFVRGNMARGRRNRRSPSAFRRRGGRGCRSNHLGAGASRRGPNGRPRSLTKRGRGARRRGLLRRGADPRWSARSNARAGKRLRRRRWPGRRAAPPLAGPAPSARGQQSGRSPRRDRGAARLRPGAPPPRASARAPPDRSAVSRHGDMPVVPGLEGRRGNVAPCAGRAARAAISKAS